LAAGNRVVPQNRAAVSAILPHSAPQGKKESIMSQSKILLAVSLLTVGIATLVAGNGTRAKETVPAVLNFTMNSLGGNPVNLSKYEGKVVLMVNVASKCGYTPQYKALEALHEKYADKGLAILGFPANDFGRQEPGSDKEIAEFCQRNYGVKFDMFSKVTVLGDGKCPLYKLLTSPETNPGSPGEVKWNFEKFLISRDGRIIARFRSEIAPDSAEMIKAIEAELNKSAAAATH
jgi:glutathione peroxidase